MSDPKTVVEFTMKVSDYVEAFDDIDELKKAARILLEQDGKIIDDLIAENDKLTGENQQLRKEFAEILEENERLRK